MGQAPVTPVIRITKNHADFRIMTGNRSVDRNHVQRLKREMEYDPLLLRYSPILVNEHMFVIDGQHRLQAAKELGLPVHYVVGEGMTVDVARHLNATQRQWTLLDFAHSYADSGKEDYQKFLEANHTFSNISPSVVRLYLSGLATHSDTDDFRRGAFKIKDFDIGINNLNKLSVVTRKSGNQMNTPMARSFLQLFTDNPDFDFDHFMSKLDRENARGMLIASSTIRNCLRSIEDVYNFQSNTRVRLY
jgi:hypothetical protein